MRETVSSEKNPLLKQVRRAVAHGSLTDDGLAVCEGFHLLEEALASRCEIRAVIAAESAVDRVAKLNGARVIAVPDHVFAGLSTTETPQGVMALVKPREWTLEQMLTAGALVLVLDGIQDPGNAGAILRTAEAFGATGAVLLKGTVSPYNPKALRGSAGSVFRIPMLAGMDPVRLRDALEQKGIALFAAMPRAADALADANLREACAIVIGAEGAGASVEIARRAEAFRIPTAGVESLNAAVAAGVILYEARRQRNAR